jgi:hypothetical protein
MVLASLSQFLSRVFIDVRYNLAQERFAPINHRKWLRDINIRLRCRPVIEFAVNRAVKLYIAQRRPMSHMGQSLLIFDLRVVSAIAPIATESLRRGNVEKGHVWTAPS